MHWKFPKLKLLRAFFSQIKHFEKDWPSLPIFNYYLFSPIYSLKRCSNGKFCYLFPIYFEPYYALYIQIKVAKCSVWKNMKPNAFVNFSPQSIPQYYSKSYKNWRLKLLQIFGFGPELQIKQTNKQLWYLVQNVGYNLVEIQYPRN